MLKLAAALLSLFAAAAVQSAPLPIGTVPPPPPPPGPRLLTWTMGEVHCGGEIARVERLVRPNGVATWVSSVPSVTLRFRIDSDGRAVDVSRPAEFVSNYQEDLAPALVATRFASGLERADCTVEYRDAAVPFAEADRGALMAFTMVPGAQNTGEAWKQLQPVDSTCVPPPADRLRASPDFDKVPARPGERDWSIIGYDIDAQGRPVRPELMGGSGNAALDRESLAAVRKSRFARGARKGCSYRYWRAGAAIPAPAEADKESFRPADANCPKDFDWDRKPVLTYPPNYSARSIEGWAIIGFDVAPWGQLGNLKVLVAEPSADFGEAGRNVIQQASLHPSHTGYVGCVEKVRFKMGPRKSSTDAQEDVAY
jgi:hypothetical protein